MANPESKNMSKLTPKHREQMQAIVRGFDFLRDKRFARDPEFLGELLALGRFDATVDHVSTTCHLVRQRLHEAMVRYRIDNDFAGAQALLKLARDEGLMKFIPLAMDQLNAAVQDKEAFLAKLPDPSNAQLFIAVGHFLQAIYVLCLGGFWKDVETLARYALLPVVITRFPDRTREKRVSDPPGIALAAGYLAAVRGDEDTVRKLLPLYETPADAKRLWIFRPYDKLLLAAFERDQHAFDQQLEATVQAFKARGKTHRSPHGWDTGYGKLGEAMSVDVEGIAICKLATKLGLRVTIDDPQYPQAFIRHWVS
jgi:hypothetical protein